MDADGCITIKRQRTAGAVYYQLQVIVSQVSAVGLPDDVPLVIAKLAVIGGHVHCQRRERRTVPNSRPLWHWAVVGASAEAFLRSIHPYLVGKVDQADVALAYREQAVGPPGHSNPAGRPIAEAAYLRLRAMKNYHQKEPAA